MVKVIVTLKGGDKPVISYVVRRGPSSSDAEVRDANAMAKGLLLVSDAILAIGCGGGGVACGS